MSLNYTPKMTVMKITDDHYQVCPQIDFHHLNSAKNRSISNDKTNNDSFDNVTKQSSELYSSNVMENR
jgi:hypothetical protein